MKKLVRTKNTLLEIAINGSLYINGQETGVTLQNLKHCKDNGIGFNFPFNRIEDEIINSVKTEEIIKPKELNRKGFVELPNSRDIDQYREERKINDNLYYCHFYDKNLNHLNDSLYFSHPNEPGNGIMITKEIDVNADPEKVLQELKSEKEKQREKQREGERKFYEDFTKKVERGWWIVTVDAMCDMKRGNSRWIPLSYKVVAESKEQAYGKVRDLVMFRDVGKGKLKSVEFVHDIAHPTTVLFEYVGTWTDEDNLEYGETI